MAARPRVPTRPNGVTGWIRACALTAPVTVHTALRVNRHTLRLTLYDKGRKVFSARIGVGKASTGTPGGRFYIREKFRVHGVPLYGPAALGTSAYAPHLTDWPGGGVVGLHGTDQPELIPGRPSHGCIRLRNRDILRLYRLVPGAPRSTSSESALRRTTRAGRRRMRDERVVESTSCIAPCCSPPPPSPSCRARPAPPSRRRAHRT